MTVLLQGHGPVWGIAALAAGGVILRPWALPEAIWTVGGALLLVLSGLLSARDAVRGVLAGTDVYLFLTGMMLLAEVARQDGLFDWLAAGAARAARGSAARLFTLVFLVGTLVTVFLSNDATAVVLTPAVAAVMRAARVEQPLPHLFVCAFIANAASFVLPISNPANLVIYGGHMPPLLEWARRFALPSLLSIAATYAVLRLTQRAALGQALASQVTQPCLSGGGVMAACGVAATAAGLMAASAFGLPLGPSTCAAGLATAALVLLRTRRNPWELARGVAWGVLPLVAGLFVLVEALDRTGVLRDITDGLRALVARSPDGASWIMGTALAALCTLVNNLPAGLVAGHAVQATEAPPVVASAVLVGIDLGPNLSVTGSLATILWLTALRRDGFAVGAGTFLRLGVLVMPPALLLALAALILP